MEEYNWLPRSVSRFSGQFHTKEQLSVYYRKTLEDFTQPVESSGTDSTIALLNNIKRFIFMNKTPARSQLKIIFADIYNSSIRCTSTMKRLNTTDDDEWNRELPSLSQPLSVASFVFCAILIAQRNKFLLSTEEKKNKKNTVGNWSGTHLFRKPWCNKGHLERIAVRM